MGAVVRAGIHGDRVWLPYLHAPGGRWLDGNGPRDQVFSYHMVDRGQTLHFDIAQLTRLIEAHAAPFDRLRLATVVIDETDVAHVTSRHGIEAAGLEQAAKRLDEPGYLVEFEDGTCSVVDGNHRLVERHRRGLREMQMYWLTAPQWRLSLLYVPEQIGKSLAMRGVE